MSQTWERGFKGTFLNVITSIYSSTKVSLFYNSHVSTLFDTFIGPKQGNTLSLLFFYLLINDLPVLLEKQNTQSEEKETLKLSIARKKSLLFVDDLAIFSLTQHGLQ